MLKLLLLAIALLVAYWLFRHKDMPVGRDRREKPKGENTPNMVTCAHCRLYLPENESIHIDGHHFCCDEHSRLGPT
ncbi:MAG: PP0621 family protein [Pseudomonadota bacterium]